MPQEYANKTILVVGDWAVDEYWLVVRHHSEISSHIGFTHYRVAIEPEEKFIDLCGPGHVARVLYQLSGKGNKGYQIFGLGKWNDADTDFIKHIVVHKGNINCQAAAANFCITSKICQTTPEIELKTLQPNYYTKRVIRQYQIIKGELEQISRIDWQPKELEEIDDEINTTNILDKNRERLMLPNQEQVIAIVIHDHKKGVINSNLIRELKREYPNAKWFVRSKEANPTWLKIIKDKLELRVIGPEVASLLNPWDNWLFRNKVTLEALEIIEGLPEKNVILLSPKHEIIARIGTNCVTGRSGVESTLQTELNWPSAFFASLIYIMLEKNAEINHEDIKKALDLASDDNCSGIPLPKTIGIPRIKKVEPQVGQPTLWESEVIEWYQAINESGKLLKSIKTGKSPKLENHDLGIIFKDNESRLEVWRGQPQLQNYISLIKEKQQIIDRIGRRLRSFSKSGSQVRHLSILLQADPGAGKTTLVKSLAKAFGFAFLHYDLTQMLQRDDLLDLFDTVATMQARAHNPVLVFIDEINAQIDGAQVYGTFLLPLEAGYYVKRGKVFSLKPCAWIFAGTKLDIISEGTSGEKLSDFKSRISMIETIDFKSFADKRSGRTRRLGNDARL